MDHDDFQIEPIKGLPGNLPPGERILWQGAPAWKALARRAFFTRAVMVWFGLVIAWHLAALASGRTPLGEAVAAITAQAIFCAIAVGILALVAWGMARTTVYTITNRRLVMRFGLALDLTINLPFTQIVNLDLFARPDGTGDLAVALKGRDKLSYLHLWPNARPWRFRRPEPMLRAVPEADKVGHLLADALRARLDELGESLPETASRPASPASRPALHPAE